MTRVGTRIVKAVSSPAPVSPLCRAPTPTQTTVRLTPPKNMHLQLQTLPPQTISLRPKSNIHMPQLVTLTTHLNEAIKITTSTFDVPPNPSFLKAQLRLLSDLISDSISILKGQPPDDGLDTSWTVQSCASEHLEPDPGPGLSCHFTLCESLIILTIRSLEPAHAPVALGTKLGLAIGAVRRIEHDEAGAVFDYVHHASDPLDRPPIPPHPARGPEDPPPETPHRGGVVMTSTPERITPGQYTPVVVREKVRVETGDPKLMSLLAKLNSLGATLARVEENLGVILENKGPR